LVGWYGGIGLGPGHIVLDGDPSPNGKGTAAPTFADAVQYIG